MKSEPSRDETPSSPEGRFQQLMGEVARFAARSPRQQHRLLEDPDLQPAHLHALVAQWLPQTEAERASSGGPPYPLVLRLRECVRHREALVSLIWSQMPRRWRTSFLREFRVSAAQRTAMLDEYLETPPTPPGWVSSFEQLHWQDDVCRVLASADVSPQTVAQVLDQHDWESWVAGDALESPSLQAPDRHQWLRRRTTRGAYLEKAVLRWANSPAKTATWSIRDQVRAGSLALSPAVFAQSRQWPTPVTRLLARRLLRKEAAAEARATSTPSRPTPWLAESVRLLMRHGAAADPEMLAMWTMLVRRAPIEAMALIGQIEQDTGWLDQREVLRETLQRCAVPMTRALLLSPERSVRLEGTRRVGLRPESADATSVTPQAPEGEHTRPRRGRYPE